ncbi:MAG: hypothetical protein AB1591_00950 [Pseudomonadota bacterium]
MNAGFTVLLTASLASLMLSGQAAAGPRYADRDFMQFSAQQARIERDYGKRDEREMHGNNRSQDRKGERKMDESGREHGYGYGYERRYPQPRHDERGRR